MQNREVQNPKAKSDLAGSRIRESSVQWVAFGAGKIGGYFNLSVSNGGRFFWSQKPRFSWFQNGSRYCANGAVMLCWFGAKKAKQRSSVKSKGSHNKSFKRTAD